MKRALVHPQEDVWRFERTDALVKFCDENGLTIHGPTLVWHAQTNDWFFRGGDKAVVTERLRNHIHTLVGRYKGKVRTKRSATARTPARRTCGTRSEWNTST